MHLLFSIWRCLFLESTWLIVLLVGAWLIVLFRGSGYALAVNYVKCMPIEFDATTTILTGMGFLRC